MKKIAIDGPSGAGKSYLARALAEKLGFVYVDTGALYRAIGLYFFRRGIDGGERDRIARETGAIRVDIEYREDGQHVLLDGEDVSREIRLPEISMMASAVSAVPEVRAHLLSLQRRMSELHDVIMDGRDIGTVILPDADVKIFLTASNETRAARRFLELREKGVDTTLEEVLADIIRRDAADRGRSIAPAVPADDAVILDNSSLDCEGTLKAALGIVADKFNRDR